MEVCKEWVEQKFKNKIVDKFRIDLNMKLKELNGVELTKPIVMDEDDIRFYRIGDLVRKRNNLYNDIIKNKLFNLEQLEQAVELQIKINKEHDDDDTYDNQFSTEVKLRRTTLEEMKKFLTAKIEYRITNSKKFEMLDEIKDIEKSVIENGIYTKEQVERTLELMNELRKTYKYYM